MPIFNMNLQFSDNFDIVIDGQNFLYCVEVFLTGFSLIGYVYFERFKNFEKFNVDMESRDYLLK